MGACELHNRNDVRVVVLRAAGKMFCAGASPAAFTDAAAQSTSDNRKAIGSFMKFLFYFQNLPQFTIHCVRGQAWRGTSSYSFLRVAEGGHDKCEADTLHS